MHSAANVVTGLVAALHAYFLVLEMFLWTKPRTRRIFGLTEQQAEITRTLAANQGLYNGFLAAGLVWGVGANEYPVKVFFLGCVMTAGIYGAMTANRRILYVQALPAALALALVCAAQA
jgi:putative membrane protein